MLVVPLVAFAVVACLLAASFAAARADRAIYRERVTEAIRDGTLARPAFTPFARHARSYRYHYNDCLIASMLVLAPKEGRFRSAVSPLTPVRIPAARPDASVPPAPFCGNLEAALAAPDQSSEYYHRYVHGDWVVAALLLLVLPFGAATGLLCATLLALTAATAAGAAGALISGRGDPRRNAAYAAMALAFLLFGGLGLYGWSFSFAPSDIVLAGFLLYAWKRPLAETGRRVVVASAIFGALTAAFEFLVGAAPAGLALLLAVFAFGGDLDRRTLRQAGMAMLGFAGAFVFTFAFKFALVAALWGWPEVASAGSQLLLRTAGESAPFADRTASALSGLGIPPSWAHSGRLGLVAVGALKLVYHAAPFEYGSAALGVLVIAVSPLALLALSAWLAFTGKAAEARIRATLLLAAALGTFGWYVLFAEHTIGHAPFMMRPLSWLAIILYGYIAWMVAGRRSREGWWSRGGLNP
ncbi:MAG: hypothetical protein ACJ8EB_01895 [Allosphingosinicella sp.]